MNLSPQQLLASLLSNHHPTNPGPQLHHDAIYDPERSKTITRNQLLEMAAFLQREAKRNEQRKLDEFLESIDQKYRNYVIIQKEKSPKSMEHLRIPDELDDRLKNLLKLFNLRDLFDAIIFDKMEERFIRLRNEELTKDEMNVIHDELLSLDTIPNSDLPKLPLLGSSSRNLDVQNFEIEENQLANECLKKAYEPTLDNLKKVNRLTRKRLQKVLDSVNSEISKVKQLIEDQKKLKNQLEGKSSVARSDENPNLESKSHDSDLSLTSLNNPKKREQSQLNLGYFFAPYFKDLYTGFGPENNKDSFARQLRLKKFDSNKSINTTDFTQNADDILLENIKSYLQEKKVSNDKRKILTILEEAQSKEEDVQKLLKELYEDRKIYSKIEEKTKNRAWEWKKIVATTNFELERELKSKNRKRKIDSDADLIPKKLKKPSKKVIEQVKCDPNDPDTRKFIAEDLTDEEKDYFMDPKTWKKSLTHLKDRINNMESKSASHKRTIRKLEEGIQKIESKSNMEQEMQNMDLNLVDADAELDWISIINRKISKECPIYSRSDSLVAGALDPDTKLPTAEYQYLDETSDKIFELKTVNNNSMVGLGKDEMRCKLRFENSLQCDKTPDFKILLGIMQEGGKYKGKNSVPNLKLVRENSISSRMTDFTISTEKLPLLKDLPKNNWVYIAKRYREITGHKLSPLQLCRAYKKKFENQEHTAVQKEIEDEEDISLTKTPIKEEKMHFKSKSSATQWSKHDYELLKLTLCERYNLDSLDSTSIFEAIGNVIENFVPDENSILYSFPEKSIFSTKRRIKTILDERYKHKTKTELSEWSAVEELRLALGKRYFDNLAACKNYSWVEKNGLVLDRKWLMMLPDVFQAGFQEEEIQIIFRVFEDFGFDLQNKEVEEENLMADEHNKNMPNTQQFQEITRKINENINQSGINPEAQKETTRRVKIQEIRRFYQLLTEPETDNLLDESNEYNQKTSSSSPQGGPSNLVTDISTNLHETRSQLINLLMDVLNGKQPLAILNTISSCRILLKYLKLFNEQYSKTYFRGHYNSKWKNHWSVDSITREIYIHKCHIPEETVKNSSFALRSRDEMSKLMAAQHSIGLQHKFYTLGSKKLVPPNQVNFTMLERLQQQMPKLLERASQFQNTQVHSFARNEVKGNFVSDLADINMNIDSMADPPIIPSTYNPCSSYSNLSVYEEFLLAKKAKYAYIPEIFSPCDAKIRIWDFNYRSQLKKTKINYQDLVDLEKLRVAIGFEQIQDSPLLSIINNGRLFSVVGQNNGHCTLFQNFTKNFNSLLTWPMIFSQVMPKINRNIRNKGSAAFDEYVEFYHCQKKFKMTDKFANLKSARRDFADQLQHSIQSYKSKNNKPAGISFYGQYLNLQKSDAENNENLSLKQILSDWKGKNANSINLKSNGIKNKAKINRIAESEEAGPDLESHIKRWKNEFTMSLPTTNKPNSSSLKTTCNLNKITPFSEFLIVPTPTTLNFYDKYDRLEVKLIKNPFVNDQNEEQFGLQYLDANAFYYQQYYQNDRQNFQSQEKGDSQ